MGEVTGPGVASEQNDLPASLRVAFAESASSSSNADGVFRAVSDAITAGILVPGQTLSENELARLFGVSRTPVREALMRLEDAQLATRTRRGLTVSRISQRQIVEVYEIREALDGVAARLAAQFATEIDIFELRNLNAAMAAAAERMEYMQMAALNVTFHEVLARASRNEMLGDFVVSVHRWVRRFRTTTFSESGRALAALEEHARVIDAIVARDADGAESAARLHMRRALGIRMRMEGGTSTAPNSTPA